ncbi:HalOD1 output domain-containing protein [Natrarchaeobius oligotrophus]|uniref:Halobacterial output domain-containing protein n=1 Tax=Natrarchaeobius chitinivorans TaxID=1679083 RepID=A0A3N6MSM4_NATCH|nr:HalOD1 output domain-containing protein [Natrarchaeobius chitinivorans]RQH00821.1 hypothetical protein EA472_09300 [Natrarchaeobius chitinivorans]
MPSVDDSADAPDSRDSYVTTFDPTLDDQPSDAVVSAVASLVERDPIELTPLYEAVEPDALDTLVEHAQEADGAGTHQVWFTYEGFDVGVRSDGEVRIRDGTSVANSSA